ncbi:MAG: hypothetical protein B7O98_06795 [Zestosphaera tikiterensis]|uniref:PaREP1 family protein n=1 Tax=Zestosphaera tikiterensis TaxID=1973259 RepID=A0A2R7Y4Q3_9CREN|nr:MAG: hypothetical protein B7O98_06795 [Zestosphaera tikiterensis]
MTSCKATSYSEALRHVNIAIDAFKKYLSGENHRENLTIALTNILKSLIILKSGSYISDMDLTNIASIALDKGIIDAKTYAEIVTANLIIKGYYVNNLRYVEDLFKKLLDKVVALDPYVNQQLSLFRY